MLAQEQLSWSAFVVLFVLRVWGPQESHSLAKEAGITGGTLTGVSSKTLEERGLAQRTRARDGRAAGRRDRRRRRGAGPSTGSCLAFNDHEAIVTPDLTATSADELSRLLRTVLRSVDALDGRGGAVGSFGYRTILSSSFEGDGMRRRHG